MPLRIGGGITPKDIWTYTTRTLTTYTKIAEIIKNLDYTRAAPEDYIYSNLVRVAGLVTTSELAAFINDTPDLDLWARIFEANPGNVYPIQDIADILNDPNLTISNLKSILASALITADKVQEILYKMADKGYYDRLLELFTFDASDETIAADTSYTAGVTIRRNLTINAGVTLTLAAAPAVIIADTITNNGSIISGWVKGAGGAAGADGTGDGGDGAGGIILLSRTISIGTISADGKAGADGSTVTYGAAGVDGGAGEFWIISGDVVPSGGDGGSVSGNEGIGNPNGGGGGGDGYSGGDGGNAAVTEFTSANDLLAELFKCAIDYWMVNVLGKTPTSTKSFPSLGGSGGGGGVAYDTYCAGGGGGGGGGEIIIYGTSVTAGTLNANAGNGGDGGNEGTDDSGGGGGGGGVIYVFYKSLTGTNTFNVAGGVGGVGDYNGAAGGDGFGKEIAV